MVEKQEFNREKYSKGSWGHWKILVAFWRIYPIVLFLEMPHSCLNHS